jgi:tetratricopeptide (TPR) repeat protein
LFDGGYYDRALAELLNTPVKTVVRSKGDLVEYKYRLARIYHETGSLSKAEEYYRQAISLGRNEPYYFAAGAALQLGLLYENLGKPGEAAGAFRLCLSINTPEYKTSLHQKAKAGLKRLNAVQSKT